MPDVDRALLRSIIRRHSHIEMGGRDHTVSYGERSRYSSGDVTECQSCHRMIPRQVNLWMSYNRGSSHFTFMCESCMVTHLIGTGAWRNYE